MNKRVKGFELAISTLVIIVLSMLVLAALILALTGGFKYFLDKIKGYSGTDIDNLNNLCQTQCNLDNKNSFCHEQKLLGKENITCLDKRLDVDCEINCD